MPFKDDLGDRMKMYEHFSAGQKLMPRLPVLIRLDGKCFSKFTRGLKRPYDERMSRLMEATAICVVEETGAIAGYTQSDEINLLLHARTLKSSIYFDGRVQKMIGDAAAFTSLVFNEKLPQYLPEKSHLRPRFDCRVWNAPTKDEAVNAFLWREMDATRNSISMAAQSVFSHKTLQGKPASQMQEMLFQSGINWNDYPSFFKRGVFIRRQLESRAFSAEEIEKLPPQHAARSNSELVVERRCVSVVKMPPFTKVINRVGVLFDGDEPVVDNDDDWDDGRGGTLA